MDLIGKKHAAHLVHLHDPQCTTKKYALRSICSTIQLKLSEMQDSWLNARVDEIQGYADKNCMEKPSSINNKAIKWLLQVPVNKSLDVTPTLGEVQIAIRQLSSGKAPWFDSIPVEIYKEDGSALTDKLLTLIQLMWMKEQLLQDFKAASIIHIYKQKGNWQACDNHCRISLLSILGKIIAKVLLNHLNNHLKDSYQRVNATSVRNVGLLTWCLLQDTCKGSVRNRTLNSTQLMLIWWRHLIWLVDGLLRIMAKYGCPEKLITIVRQFHAGMHARVQNNGESFVAFPVTNGVKQECVLAPTLYSIMFSAMLFDAFSGLDNGIGIQYHTDGSVFNFRKLRAKTRMKTGIINEFLFADDCALSATTKANMQNSVDKFSMACESFGLTISTKNTEVMHQPVPGKLYVEPNITIKGQRLKVVESSPTSAAPSLSLSS